MRKLLLGGIAAALAFSVVAPAQARPTPACAEGLELVCTVVFGTICTVTGEQPCYP